MSLNEIQLHGKLLHDLYRDVLISELTDVGKLENQAIANENSTGKIRSLGKNKKNYCFVVSYPKETFLPDDKMEVLIKIMQASRLSMDDIALLNTAGVDLTIEAIRQQFEPLKMVLLGVNPADIRLPIQFPAYKPQSYAGCTYVYADSLDEMDNSTNGRKIKGNLWAALKDMFGV
jgi:hypothetical protein